MNTCYLCGKPIEADETQDHVPARSLFPKELRRRFNLSALVTLPTHGSCNGGFEKGEEYFLFSVAPLAHDSGAGRAAVAELKGRWRAGDSVPLGFRILQEFDSRPGGLYLPRDRVLKHVDRQRADRVLLKIVRGLHWHEGRGFLPPPHEFTTEIIGPEDNLPNHWAPVIAEPSRGRYRAVFDWKYRLYAVDRPDAPRFAVWALLFWDRVMAFVAFHDSRCECERCAAA